MAVGVFIRSDKGSAPRQGSSFQSGQADVSPAPALSQPGLRCLPLPALLLPRAARGEAGQAEPPGSPVMEKAGTLGEEPLTAMRGGEGDAERDSRAGLCWDLGWGPGGLLGSFIPQLL